MPDTSDGWIDAAQKQPAHARKVLALEPKDNEGYTADAGYEGRPCAWVIARWDARQNKWAIVGGNVGVHIIWWRELPKEPDGTLIVPPDNER